MKHKAQNIFLLVFSALLFNIVASGCDEPFVSENDCVGTWQVTFNYDSWGNYEDGGVMVLYYNGRYDYYFSDWDYRMDRIGYYGEWWTDRDNLLYTYGRDTYSYRITTQTYNMMRLRNNLPPGDMEVWYRY